MREVWQEYFLSGVSLSREFPLSREFIVFDNFATFYVSNVFMRVVVEAFYRHPNFVGFRVLYRMIAEVIL